VTDTKLDDTEPWYVTYAKQFKPYPPFIEPDDWRVSHHTKGSERDALRAREAADEATSKHVSRHDVYDHPFCRECWDRFQGADQDGGMGYPLTYADAEAKRKAATAEYPSQANYERIVKMYNEDVWTPKPGDGANYGISDEALDAWVDFIEDRANYDYHVEERERDVLGRAHRYLLLRGKLPADEVPIERPDFSDLFLERDELDELPTPEPLIERVLPRHAYGILRGRDQSFKSFVALDWALCLATGKPWQGHAAEPVRVLYIAGEGAYGLAGRVDAWEKGWRTDIDPSMFVVRTAALNMHKPGPAFDHLLDHIVEGGYGLVVIDTLRRVSGSAEGNGSDMGAVVDNIDRIKQATADGTVLVVAHTQKDDGDTRGYSGIEDDADFVWHAKRSEDFLTLENTKQKDGPEHSPIYLTASAGHGSLVLNEAAATAETMTGSQEKIIDALTDVFPDGASGTMLMDVTALPRSTFFNAIAPLIKAAHVSKSGPATRPLYILTENLLSNEVQEGNTGPDLHESNQSKSVQLGLAGSPSSPTALKGGTETQPSRETA
jgi:hypothetical protein